MARRFVLKSDPDRSAVKLTIDYKRALNPQQYEVVTAPPGAYLVIAGAGTGKTRTLVYRVAYLVETGVKPEQIVLLTFTRRAAREMITRAGALLDGRCERVQGGTFHSFCLNILRRNAPSIGFERNFSVLDASDAADVIDILRNARGYHRLDKRFPRKGVIQAILSKAANRRAPIEEILATGYPQFVRFAEELHVLERDFALFKRQHMLMDYDDLLHHTLTLLETNPEVKRTVGAACRQVLVDEYQDTNVTQADLVAAFASVHGNVMAVGDDAQSIYRFRGADHRNMFSFPELFPNAKVLKLEQNYRSTQPILTLANRIISRAIEKYDKQLFTEKSGGDLPAIVPAPDVQYESRFVSQMILSLREEGVPLDRIAVLFRSGFNSYDLEIELNRCNIPFVKYGGLKLSEAAHIKDLVAYLKVLDNPKDGIAWNRILQLLEGVGPKTAGDLVEWIRDASDQPFVLENRPFSRRYVESLQDLFNVLRSLYHGNLSLTEQIETLIAHYEPILKRKYYEDYPKRQQDLEHFVTVAEPFKDRSDFLASLALDPIELTTLGVDVLHEDEKPLVLSTIHSAKGLEFHTVFIIHALEGVIPSGYALDDPEAIDEELRLLYVAVTRAEERLYITYPVIQYRRSLGEYLTSPSRFIADIPAGILEPWTLVDEQADTPSGDLPDGDASGFAYLPF